MCLFLHHFSSVVWRLNVFLASKFQQENKFKKEKMNKNNPSCPVCWRMLCQFVKAKSIFKTKYQNLMLGGNRQAHLFLPCKITVDTRGTLFQFALDQFLMRTRRTFWYGKHISQVTLQLRSFSYSQNFWIDCSLLGTLSRIKAVELSNMHNINLYIFCFQTHNVLYLCIDL